MPLWQDSSTRRPSPAFPRVRTPFCHLWATRQTTRMATSPARALPQVRAPLRRGSGSARFGCGQERSILLLRVRTSSTRQDASSSTTLHRRLRRTPRPTRKRSSPRSNSYCTTRRSSRRVKRTCRRPRRTTSNSPQGRRPTAARCLRARSVETKPSPFKAAGWQCRGAARPFCRPTRVAVSPTPPSPSCGAGTRLTARHRCASSARRRRTAGPRRSSATVPRRPCGARRVKVQRRRLGSSPASCRSSRPHPMPHNSPKTPLQSDDGKSASTALKQKCSTSISKARAAARAAPRKRRRCWTIMRYVTSLPHLRASRGRRRRPTRPARAWPRSTTLSS
mmetsp:Transcript_20976/g.71039  ORF Transcript_20976/g.71039 Transcript_20976/m.71039 type:complete len:336 (+) Transcript_20976:585-1592(+)